MSIDYLKKYASILVRFFNLYSLYCCGTESWRVATPPQGALPGIQYAFCTLNKRQMIHYILYDIKCKVCHRASNYIESNLNRVKVKSNLIESKVSKIIVSLAYEIDNLSNRQEGSGSQPCSEDAFIKWMDAGFYPRVN